MDSRAASARRGLWPARTPKQLAAARCSLGCSAASAGFPVFRSQLRTAESKTAAIDILRSRASRSSSNLSSLDTRQLYTSLFMYYIVVHWGPAIYGAWLERN